VYPGVPVTEDLKSLASRYLHNPVSNVDKLRIRRSRSGTVKVLIFLDIPVASGALRLEPFAPAILVRVLPPPFPTCTYSFPYCASVYGRCPTMVPPATYLLLSAWQGLLGGTPALDIR
jgi:hypothetical protein